MTSICFSKVEQKTLECITVSISNVSRNLFYVYVYVKCIFYHGSLSSGLKTTVLVTSLYQYNTVLAKGKTVICLIQTRRKEISTHTCPSLLLFLSTVYSQDMYVLYRTMFCQVAYFCGSSPWFSNIVYDSVRVYLGVVYALIGPFGFRVPSAICFVILSNEILCPISNLVLNSKYKEAETHSRPQLHFYL